ncbi:MAG: hypothetical protein LKJ47_06275 [Bifidobacteriaceae bacterium]|jgi:hypothetical protein|nr:hypothetical protein [Bifidobacteriaceae bacterium]
MTAISEDTVISAPLSSAGNLDDLDARDTLSHVASRGRRKARTWLAEMGSITTYSDPSLTAMM